MSNKKTAKRAKKPLHVTESADKRPSVHVTGAADKPSRVTTSLHVTANDGTGLLTDIRGKPEKSPAKNAENQSFDTQSTEKDHQTGGNTALPAHEAVAGARGNRRLCQRPGQAVYNGKLDDALEREILQHIGNGSSWSESARLVGVDRNTCSIWRSRGAEYLQDPDGKPEYARYGQFVEAIELAVAKCKAWVIGKILNSDDWRALRFWLINNSGGEYKSEHIRSEVSGIDGSAIPVQFNPFEVHFVMDPPPPGEKFITIDERKPEEIANQSLAETNHKPSAVLDDPFATEAQKEKGLHAGVIRVGPKH